MAHAEASPQQSLRDLDGDLFVDDVPSDFIRRAYDVMVASPHLIFQVLTKRPTHGPPGPALAGERVGRPLGGD